MLVDNRGGWHAPWSLSSGKRFDNWRMYRPWVTVDTPNHVPLIVKTRVAFTESTNERELCAAVERAKGDPQVPPMNQLFGLLRMGLVAEGGEEDLVFEKR
jgi:hypothetical protein